MPSTGVEDRRNDGSCHEQNLIHGSAQLSFHRLREVARIDNRPDTVPILLQRSAELVLPAGGVLATSTTNRVPNLLQRRTGTPQASRGGSLKCSVLRLRRCAATSV